MDEDPQIKQFRKQVGSPSDWIVKAGIAIAVCMLLILGPLFSLLLVFGCYVLRYLCQRDIIEQRYVVPSFWGLLVISAVVAFAVLDAQIRASDRAQKRKTQQLYDQVFPNKAEVKKIVDDAIKSQPLDFEIEER